MSKAWPTVHLGEVLIEEKQRIGTYDASGLPLLGVSNKNGLHRSVSPRIGDMSRYLRVEKDWFAYNPMRINVGSIGCAETDSQTGVISPDYVVFSCTDRIVPRLLFEFLKHRRGLRAINAATAGSVRERLYFESLARIQFPLPPLPEQQRVVARIEELVGQIQEARRLREQSGENIAALLVAMAHRHDLDEAAKSASGWRKLPLAECIHVVDDLHRVSVDGSYPNLGIYSFGRGLFPKPPIEGVATSAAVLRQVKAGQFIYSRLFAFEGAYGIVTDEYDGSYVSAEYPTFECDPAVVRIEFLEAYFKAPSIWKEVAVGSKGLGDRRQRVQPAQVLEHRAWIPPMALQSQLAKVRAEVDALRNLHAEATAELNALLPAILDRAFKGELV
jgi:type I restriction enzyme, S subunit